MHSFNRFCSVESALDALPNDDEPDSGRLAGGDQRGDDIKQRRIAFHGRAAMVLEFDPAFVESVEHANAGQRILRALGAKDSFPAFAGYDLDADRPLKDVGEGPRQFVCRYANGALKLEDPRSAPVLPDELGGKSANILGGDHRERLIGGLQEAA